MVRAVSIAPYLVLLGVYQIRYRYSHCDLQVAANTCATKGLSFLGIFSTLGGRCKGVYRCVGGQCRGLIVLLHLAAIPRVCYLATRSMRVGDRVAIAVGARGGDRVLGLLPAACGGTVLLPPTAPPPTMRGDTSAGCVRGGDRVALTCSLPPPLLPGKPWRGLAAAARGGEWVLVRAAPRLKPLGRGDTSAECVRGGEFLAEDADSWRGDTSAPITPVAIRPPPCRHTTMQIGCCSAKGA